MRKALISGVVAATMAMVFASAATAAPATSLGVSSLDRTSNARVECLAGHKVRLKAHPSKCFLFEHGGSGTALLRSMSWKHWGGRSVVGSGKIAFFDHPDYGGKVRVGLRKLRKSGCASGRFYTKAKIKVKSGLAAPEKFSLILGTGCAARTPN